MRWGAQADALQLIPNGTPALPSSIRVARFGTMALWHYSKNWHENRWQTSSDSTVDARGKSASDA